jgi:hypothetical protein
MNLILLYSNHRHILATNVAIFHKNNTTIKCTFLMFTVYKGCSANDVNYFYSHLHNLTNCVINSDSRFYLFLFYHHH